MSSRKDEKSEQPNPRLGTASGERANLEDSDKTALLPESLKQDPRFYEAVSLLLRQERDEERDYEGEIGTREPNSSPDVDITLHPSREKPVAGELWSVAAEVYNRASVPIWIVDTKTRLTLAPEMYGLSSKTGSMGAFFPTIDSRMSDEVVRIDPGGKYAVVWKIDPVSAKGSSGAEKSLWTRVGSAVRNYAFFNPGTFRLSATAHIWSNPPKFSDNGNVENLGDAYVQTVAREITMEASPWVLIVGATCGGILAFILQLLFGVVPLDSGIGSVIMAILVGLASAVILTAVATVLISRLATADFLVVVKVKDIWGAIATGFVVQWLGYGALVRLLGDVQPVS